MKNFFLAVILGVATLGIFSSCSKDELPEPKKSEIQCPKDTVQVVNPCGSVIVDDLMLRLSECVIYDTVQYGTSDEFEFFIIPNDDEKLFEFTVYGYGEGFPDYAIAGVRSGGGIGWASVTISWNTHVDYIFPGPGDYSAILPIKVKRNNIEKTLNLQIYLHIK